MRNTKSSRVPANTIPARPARGRIAFDAIHLIIITAVALIALVSASLATLHTARAQEKISTITSPGTPAFVGRRAVVTGGYSSEVGPRPLLVFTAPVVHATMLPGFAKVPSRTISLFGLLLMAGLMVTLTACLWRHTAAKYARVPNRNHHRKYRHIR